MGRGVFFIEENVENFSMVFCANALYVGGKAKTLYSALGADFFSVDMDVEAHIHAGKTIVGDGRSCERKEDRG